MIVLCTYYEHVSREYSRKIRETYNGIQIYYYEDILTDVVRLEDCDGNRMYGIVFVNPHLEPDMTVLNDTMHEFKNLGIYYRLYIHE